MDLDHRLDQAEAKPAPGGGAAVVGAEKAAEDLVAQGRGDAGAVVGDLDDHGAIGLGEPQVDPSALRGIFDGVVDQVAQGLEQQVAITDHPGRWGGRQVQLLSPLGRDRLIEFRQVLHQRCQVDRGEGGAPAAGLDAGDAQQGVEGAKQFLGVGDDLLRRGPGRMVLAQFGAQHLELGAQARQGGAQVVGDVVRDLAHAGHQRFDAGQHVVESGGELVEVVAAPADRDAPGQVAVHDLAAGLVDRLQAAQHAVAQHPATEQGQGGGDGEPPGEGVEDQTAGPREVAHVPPHQQVQVPGQPEHLAPGGVLLAVIRSAVAQPELHPALGVRVPARPAVEVADQGRQVLVG